MSTEKIAELRKKSPSDLGNLLVELARERLNLCVQKAVGQSIKTHRLKEVRREMAKIKTIFSEKKDEKGAGSGT